MSEFYEPTSDFIDNLTQDKFEEYKMENYLINDNLNLKISNLNNKFYTLYEDLNKRYNNLEERFNRRLKFLERKIYLENKLSHILIKNANHSINYSTIKIYSDFNVLIIIRTLINDNFVYTCDKTKSFF